VRKSTDKTKFEKEKPRLQGLGLRLSGFHYRCYGTGFRVMRGGSFACSLQLGLPIRTDSGTRASWRLTTTGFRVV
jgi:hypothetical protein